MVPPPPLPPRTQRSLPDAGSLAALLPLSPPLPRRGGEDLLPAPGGRRLGSPSAPGSVVPPDAGAGSSGRGRARRVQVQARGSCGAMNGTANPLLDREEHCLRLGESFEKRPRASFHTIRCKPALPSVPFGPCARFLTNPSPSSSLGSPRPRNPCLRQLPSLLPQILRDLGPPFSQLTPKPNPSPLPTILLSCDPKYFFRRLLAPFFFIRPPSPSLCETYPSLLRKDCDPMSDSSSPSNPSPFLMTLQGPPRLKDSSRLPMSLIDSLLFHSFPLCLP